MRPQRRAAVTVTLVAISADDNGLGDITETPTLTTVEGAIFEPERITETPGDDAAAVVQPAVFNIPGDHELDAAAQILIGAVEAEDLDAYDGPTWYVVGGSTLWLDRTKVPVSVSRPV